MAKKEPKLKPHTDYEESLIYMSYRYAIGRHTIHAHSHACDLISHEYERFKLNPNRMAFTSMDINRSIEDVLRWCRLNLYIHDSYQRNLHPIDLLIKAITSDNGYVKYDLRKVKKIVIEVDREGNIDSNVEQGEEIINEFPWTDIDDLEIWYKFAKLLDIREHKTCKLINGEDCEYFEAYEKVRDVDDNYKFILKKIPINTWVKNPYNNYFIPNSSILKC